MRFFAFSSLAWLHQLTKARKKYYRTLKNKSWYYSHTAGGRASRLDNIKVEKTIKKTKGNHCNFAVCCRSGRLCLLMFSK